MQTTTTITLNVEGLGEGPALAMAGLADPIVACFYDVESRMDGSWQLQFVEPYAHVRIVSDTTITLDELRQLMQAIEHFQRPRPTTLQAALRTRH